MTNARVTVGSQKVMPAPEAHMPSTIQNGLNLSGQPLDAAAPLLQRKCACGGTPGPSGECEKCRRKRTGVVQRQAVGPQLPTGVPPIVHEVLRSPGQLLDPSTRAFMEPRFGHDFSRVRVHTDTKAAESARAVNAAAYTVGQDIVFGAGQNAPQSSFGQRLLAHELAHVVQADGSTLQAAPSAMDTGPADPLEIEAERAAEEALTGRTPRIALRGPGGRLRRQGIVDEPAAGCGICKDPTLVGSEVHALVQAAFPPTYTVEASFQLPTSPGGGRLDLLHVTLSPEDPPSTVEIGEIKPNNVQGVKDGASDLAFYMRELRVLFPPPMWEVEPMALPPPVISTLYHDGISPACPSQTVSVINSGGLYLYSCVPPRSTVPSTCCTPVPPPLPHKKDVKEDDKKKVDEEGKEKDKDKPPVGPPVPVPVHARDIGLLLAALAAGGYLLSKAKGAARGRALAYVTAIAAIVLIANGAEASVGLEGDDALEALFKLAESKGQTLPEDIKEAMRKDPKLKETLAKAAKSGNYSAAQRETGERLARAIAQYKDELTEEELEILLKATEGAKGSVPKGDLTIEDLKRQIEAKKKAAQGTPGAGGTKGGTGTGGGVTVEGTPPSTTPEEEGPAPQPLPDPAQRLQDALVKKGGKGPRLSKAELAELRQILTSTTPPLTDAEVDTLLTKVVSAEGKAAADLLNSVREGVAQLRAPKPAAGDQPKAGAEGGEGGTPAPKPSKGDKKPEETPGQIATDDAVNKAKQGKKDPKSEAVLEEKIGWAEAGTTYIFVPKDIVFENGKPFNGSLVGRDTARNLFLGSGAVTPRLVNGAWQLEVSAGIKLNGAAGLYGTTRKFSMPALPGVGLPKKK